MKYFFDKPIKILICSWLLALNLNASAKEHRNCGKVKITIPENSFELAQIMGKNQVIDLKYMTMFDDGEAIPKGKIILISSPDFIPKVLEGKKHYSQIYHYNLPTGDLLSLNFNKNKATIRGLAGNSTCFIGK